MLPNVDVERVNEALVKFDRELRDTTEYRGWDSDERQRFGLRSDNKLYPPKIIVSLATGVPLSQFGGGRETNTWLAERNFAVELIQLPPESEVRVALHELLLEFAPEGVKTDDAYRLLAERLKLPAQLQTRLMKGPDGEIHWHNRVRYARLKLVEQGRLDGTERGTWKLAERPEQKIWIEKTIVANRPDREHGEFALGRALWSPRRTRDDSDGYWAMRDVQPGDVVLHLVDNASISGASIVETRADPNFIGLQGSDWEGMPAYLVRLRDYTPCSPPLERSAFLGNPEFREILIRIRAENKHLFYDKDLNLNQGHYLTEAVPELALLMDRAFGEENNGLPHFNDELRQALSARAGRVAPSPVEKPLETPASTAVQSILANLGSDNSAWLYAPGESARLWGEFRRESILAIGWDGIGDLRGYPDKSALGTAISKATGTEGYPKHAAQACDDFLRQMKPGDLVVVKNGQTRLLGFGLVSGDYEFRAERNEYKNVRRCDWQLVGDWPSPERLVTKTLTHKDRKEAERLLLAMSAGSDSGTTEITQEKTSASAPQIQPRYSLQELCEDLALEPDTPEMWLSRLRRKKQMVFQGPPGTGKTYIAQALARHIVSETAGRWDLVQFHPSYGYEDFISGIQPDVVGGHLSFSRIPGRFSQFCQTARNSTAPHVLIIDEINRANLSKVFGELMFLLEYRDQRVTLAGGESFTIPDNVYLIATMNTADRSIALVDHALRRRFTFFHLDPDYEILERHLINFELPAPSLVSVLKGVNGAINDRNYEVGISFFLKDGEELRNTLAAVWEGEIEPYLEEYFYADPKRVEPYRWRSLITGELADWQPPS